jgi:site-specific DNA-methyltransferase (adenine-specific)
MKADAIYFVKGRLKFGNGENSAPFPSAVIVFRKHDAEFPMMGVIKS